MRVHVRAQTTRPPRPRRRGREPSPKTSATDSRSGRGASRRAGSTTRSVRRSSTRSRGCRGTRSRGPRSAFSPGARPELRALGASTACRRRDGVRQRREAGPRPRRRSPGAGRSTWPSSTCRRKPSPRRPRARSPHPGVDRRDGRGHVRRGPRSRALRERPREGRALVLFLGSNIGNFEPEDAADFLHAVRAALRPGDRLLLGADLRKNDADVVVAYDDPLGVTAAFNRNLLVRMNRELGADFDLAAWDHRALWNAEADRVEMHLVSRRPQHVSIPAAGVSARFHAGESIFTEASYKYPLDVLVASLGAVGFVPPESVGRSGVALRAPRSSRPPRGLRRFVRPAPRRESQSLRYRARGARKAHEGLQGVHVSRLQPPVGGGVHVERRARGCSPSRRAGSS